MGLLDDLKSKAPDLFGGDIGGMEELSNTVHNTGNAAQDTAHDTLDSLQGFSADAQEQITQYAEEHGISIEAARDHFLGNN